MDVVCAIRVSSTFLKLGWGGEEVIAVCAIRVLSSVWREPDVMLMVML